MKIILLGPPGAGKGTQAEFLKEFLNIPAISTGAMIRGEISEGTELGKILEDIIKAGNLVPDEVTNKLVFSRISKNDCKNGFILDGYPRTVSQAEALEDMTNIDLALLFDLSDEKVIDRLSGRRECKNCGQIYHITNNPSAKEDICDKCNHNLYIRADDNPEVILNRLKVYHDETEPIIDFYKSRGKLEIISADDSVLNIKNGMLEVIGGRE